MRGNNRSAMAEQISVVVPARNASETLGSTLDSLLTQTLQPAEIIVVDDGSTDDTSTIAERFGASVVRTPGVGLPAARNAGVARAAAAWVAFVDADDVFTADHLEIASSTMELRNADAVATDAWYWVQRRVTPFSHFSISRPGDPLTIDDLARGNPLLATCLVKRPWLERVGGYDESLPALEDYDLWIRLVQKGAEVVPATRPTMYYRREAGMSGDAVAMYASMEAVVAKARKAGLLLPAASRHASIGAGNWAMLAGDGPAARAHWRRARALGDRRLSTMLTIGASLVAPGVVRLLLKRRLTVDGRPLPLDVVRWWNTSGRSQPPVERPDRNES